MFLYAKINNFGKGIGDDRVRNNKLLLDD